MPLNTGRKRNRINLVRAGTEYSALMLTSMPSLRLIRQR